MSRLDDVLGNKPEPNVMVLGGSFQCQTCYEEVEEAHYAVDASELGWVCSKGHVSRIKDFSL